jgi:hypothetical protein
MATLKISQLNDLKDWDVRMAKAYPYTLNSYHFIQFGFYRGDDVLFIGQNPGISQKNVSCDMAKKLYDDFTAADYGYQEYMKKYEKVLYLDTCPMGNFLKEMVGNDWSNISFTNVYKNPFMNQIVDVTDDTFYKRYLSGQISIIQPKVIFCIGSLAKKVIESGEMRYQFYISQTKKIFASHYSYLQRTGKHAEMIEKYSSQLKSMLR